MVLLSPFALAYLVETTPVMGVLFMCFFIVSGLGLRVIVKGSYIQRKCLTRPKLISLTS